MGKHRVVVANVVESIHINKIFFLSLYENKKPTWQG